MAIIDKIRSLISGSATDYVLKDNSGTQSSHTHTKSQITDFPTIPAAANNGKLTIQMNGVSKGDFTANASADKTIDLGTVLTQHQDISRKIDRVITNNAKVGSAYVADSANNKRYSELCTFTLQSWQRREIVLRNDIGDTRGNGETSIIFRNDHDTATQDSNTRLFVTHDINADGTGNWNYTAVFKVVDGVVHIYIVTDNNSNHLPSVYVLSCTSDITFKKPDDTISVPTGLTQATSLRYKGIVTRPSVNGNLASINSACGIYDSGISPSDVALANGSYPDMTVGNAATATNADKAKSVGVGGSFGTAMCRLGYLSYSSDEKARCSIEIAATRFRNSEGVRILVDVGKNTATNFCKAGIIGDTNAIKVYYKVDTTNRRIYVYVGYTSVMSSIAANLSYSAYAHTGNWVHEGAAESTYPTGLTEAGSYDYRGNITGNADTANRVNFDRTNEINFSNVPTTGNKQRVWFNYRNGDTGATDSSNKVTEYYFGNRNAGTDGVKLFADEFSGNAATATQTDNIKKVARNDNANIPILLGAAGDSATNYGGVSFDSGVTLNPSTNTITANINGKAEIANRMEYPQFDENFRYLRIGSGNAGKWIKIASVTYSGTYGSGVSVITCFGRWNNVQQVQFGLKHSENISVNTFNYINVTDVTSNERIGYVQSGSTFDFWVKSKSNVLVVGIATDRGQGTFGSWNVSTDTDLEGKISSSEPSGIVYAGYGNFLGNAATATRLIDYGSSSNETIKVGWRGSSVTGTPDAIAVYTTNNSERAIKDMSVADMRKLMNGTSIGSESRPVYINSSGIPTVCSVLTAIDFSGTVGTNTNVLYVV